MKKVALKKKGSLAVRLFRRLLRASSGFQESASLQDRDTHVDIPRNSYSNYQEKIKIALEVERIKAEAIMERKRCLFIC